ncbi:Helix-turn-helix domain protein [Clostridium ljungdahlii DSM 13528]|uniref:Helix-turn-helix domain protein n=1 Tax=Clostridium ljungdahlii (strain ATCC 55383 / DSM 13528 / PETC) TaxID=748727 RepID=D8GU62_CLOLD|nr:helix-turn-helix transcriptional regulator [Clostridium ljungdahlii]ADK14725.1 putative DNA-binding protein [Clostridium ljungdahlii DSM 13528]OAA84081.1 Helix-turn-helix domain protein [Clostridium ljungdahlii DSM 13528]
MIGLYFIRKLYNMSMDELAHNLNITKQTVSKWEKRKIPISDKRLNQLSKIFNIPQKYFQKELDEIDRMEIQNIKLNSELKNYEYQYEDTITDPDTGEEITVTQTSIDEGALFDFSLNSYNLNQKKLLIAIKDSMDRQFEENNDEYRDYGLGNANEILELYERFLKLVNNADIDNNTIKRVLMGVQLAYGKIFDSEKFVRKIAKDIKEYNKESKTWSDEEGGERL